MVTLLLLVLLLLIVAPDVLEFLLGLTVIVCVTGAVALAALVLFAFVGVL